MVTPVLGKKPRLLEAGVAIGYGKNISVKESAKVIKVYSMNSFPSAVTGAGKQSFKWTCERLSSHDTYLALILAGLFHLQLGLTDRWRWLTLGSRRILCHAILC